MNTEMSAVVQHFCLECDKTIINPICPECLASEFKAWLMSFPELEEKVVDSVDEFLKKHKSFRGQYVRCIKCNRGSMYLCPYCFTEFLLLLLKEARASKKIIGEFFTLFNFDFKHAGYWKEAEKLGVV